MTNEQAAVAGGKPSTVDSRPRKTHVRQRSGKEEIVRVIPNCPFIPSVKLQSNKRQKRPSAYSSARGNINFDDASSNPSSSGEVIQTAAEKAREKRLRDDPLAEVLGPLFVCCKRCGSRIKLSPKSTYDPFHWLKHRERCLKKPANVVKQKKREAEGLVYTLPTKGTSDPSGKAGISSITPPLTTDDDDEVGGHDRVKEESPSPRLDETKSPPTIVSAVRQPDLVFEDYLFRSRRKMTRDLSPLSHENWTAWNWSQLRAPVWVVASYPDGADDDDEPVMDDMEPINQSRDPVITAPHQRDNISS